MYVRQDYPEIYIYKFVLKFPFSGIHVVFIEILLNAGGKPLFRLYSIT